MVVKPYMSTINASEFFNGLKYSIVSMHMIVIFI